MTRHPRTHKLVCPYCSARQEFKADDYFAPLNDAASDVVCEHCDQKFNMVRDAKNVMAFTNLIDPWTVLSQLPKPTEEHHESAGTRVYVPAH